MHRLRAALTLSLALTPCAGAATAHSLGPVTWGGLTPAISGDSNGRLSGYAFCTTNSGQCDGVGAFFDVSGLENGDGHSHASGRCKVTPGAFNFMGTDYVYVCATDRNDDGVVTDQEACLTEDDTSNHAGQVTNHDECTGESAVTAGGANEQHADDWVEGCWAFPAPTPACPSPSQAKNFCFQDDVLGFTSTPADDTGLAGGDVSFLNQAGGSWDEVIVFVGVHEFGPDGHVGDFVATVEIAGGSACGLGLTNVSAHATAGNTRSGSGGSSLHDGACDSSHCLAFLDI